MNLKIAQIAVELPDGSFGVVALDPDRTALLLPMIEALSEGPIKILPIPGMRYVPVKEALE
ncbi:hypothetical protein FHV99_004615 [Ochrobactrum sp. P20RRXII]|nr:hypothetical protein [Ochrobactrum sp. P20RRXII]NIH77363.1 hypothetical protein [Ochrobactrum sp. P20RRXII]